MSLIADITELYELPRRTDGRGRGGNGIDRSFPGSAGDAGIDKVRGSVPAVLLNRTRPFSFLAPLVGFNVGDDGLCGVAADDPEPLVSVFRRSWEF